MMQVGRILAAALVPVGAISVGMGLVASGDDPPPPATRIDRRIAVEQLQSFSDYVGFEARFALGESSDTVLVMSGGELCDADVLVTLPGEMVPIMARAGFQRFACTGAHGERAYVEVPQ